MSTVQDLLKFKANDELQTTGPKETVLNAIRRMSDRNIGSLIVVEDGVILGIVTERDYARKIVLEGRSSGDTAVEDIMRTKVRCVSPEASVDDCRGILTEDGIRYVPVVEHGYLIGLVSIGDVVGYAIHEKDFVIDQLTLYIAGNHAVRVRQ